MLGTLKLFLKAMVARGRLTHDPSVDVTAKEDSDEGNGTPGTGGPVLTLTDYARIASHLSVIHQLALWLTRLLGLRISEASGLRVGHLHDLGDHGLLTVEPRGGSKFEVRDKETGQFRQVDAKDELKNEASVRVMWVPPVLMNLIRIVIEAFHTDPDTGEVATHARLIPGIQDPGVSGAHTFRSDLKLAGAATGLGDDFEQWLYPHHMRRSVSTQLKHSGEFKDLYWRRWLGHKAGDQVDETFYLLDNSEHHELKAMADYLDEQVRAEVGDLAIPTSVTHQWARHHPIRQRLNYVETVLAFHGWQVAAAEADDPWLSSTQIAGLLDIHPSKAREKMAAGTIPATLRAWGSGDCWQARRSDVLAYRQQLDDRIALTDPAAELGMSYHEAYRTLEWLGCKPQARTGEAVLVLTDEHAAALRAEHERIQRLHQRSMRISEAARLVPRSARTLRTYAHAAASSVTPRPTPRATCSSPEHRSSSRSRSSPPRRSSRAGRHRPARP